MKVFVVAVYKSYTVILMSQDGYHANHLLFVIVPANSYVLNILM